MVQRAYLSRTLGLLFCLLGFINALVISPSQLLEGNGLLNGSQLYSEPYGCFDASFRGDRRAMMKDCYRALAALPNYHRIREFVKGEGDRDLNPYLLPYVQPRLGCQVKVELTSGEKEESSWLSINIAANKVLNACQVGYSQESKTGGWTRVGNEDRILVTVEKAQRRASNLENASNDTSSIATS